MNSILEEEILQTFGAEALNKVESIQQLWSGYGQILRITLLNGKIDSLIVKDIQINRPNKHPKGWNTHASHQRKLKSYLIEIEWYRKWAQKSDDKCRMPIHYFSNQQAEAMTLAMEDLNTSGFSQRITNPDIAQIKVVLEWLAIFHACFMGDEADGLWTEGSYWELDRRADEWKAMENGKLKDSSEVISKKLRNNQFRTIIHGDAKLANFCFSEFADKVAAVDFQYVGGGCGMKDVAYFLSSCPNTKEWQAIEEELLEHYFTKLRTSLNYQQKTINIDQLEKEWRNLYPFAWADFVRFLKGWSPDHWKIDEHGEEMVKKVLN